MFPVLLRASTTQGADYESKETGKGFRTKNCNWIFIFKLGLRNFERRRASGFMIFPISFDFDGNFCIFTSRFMSTIWHTRISQSIFCSTIQSDDIAGTNTHKYEIVFWPKNKQKLIWNISPSNRIPFFTDSHHTIIPSYNDFSRNLMYKIGLSNSRLLWPNKNLKTKTISLWTDDWLTATSNSIHFHVCLVHNLTNGFRNNHAEA